jgi:hypothetical protein
MRQMSSGLVSTARINVFMRPGRMRRSGRKSAPEMDDRDAIRNLSDVDHDRSLITGVLEQKTIRIS